ncbi:MAG: serine/threonine protein kinase [Nitrosopumilaceae archaeon]|nr:serine/threonine protein kinase [Nitrosopumilaceae archaeon]
MMRCFLPLDKLSQEPYSTIIGYPKATKKQIKTRIIELKKLGIRDVSFQGQTKIGSLNILGKGYVGVVVLSRIKNKLVAVKIRRTDASRINMVKEAKFLKIANKAGVGPLLLAMSKNFIIMEYLDGKKISKWVNELKSKQDIKLLKSIMQKILEDCYSLDVIGLDHGELSTISKHVVIGKSKTTIIDYESASTQRRVSNVTSATQAICIGSGISKIVRKIYRMPSKNKIIKILRSYKQEQNRQNFEKILEILKL